MSSFEDPNFGMVGNDKDSFERWATTEFNLLDYIGEDEDLNKPEQHQEDLEFGLNDEERNLQQKDKLYTTLQYNQNMFGDYSNDGMRQNHFSGEFENQFPDSVGFSGAFQTQTRGVLGANTGYNNVPVNMVDSSMIPTTSKSAMPLPIPIKVEPGYETTENAADMGRTYDDSGAFSDAESMEYRHSVGSNAYSGTGDEFHPKTKPRKYRVKPDEEKKLPVYRVKREKNNDAVRRSRDKAKRIQIEKDERLAFLEQEHLRDKRAINELQKRMSTIQNAFSNAKNRCNCGAFGQQRI